MAHLILRRIQDGSEQALDLLRTQVQSLKISKLPGEDVEEAVSLIKSTHRVLKCASTTTRSHVPNDFAKIVFTLFQTSTVPEFNEIFHAQSVSIQTKADLCGTPPDWPSVAAAIGLATNAHRRLKQSGVWDASISRSSGAFTNVPQRSHSSHDHSGNPSGCACFNCGSHDHMLNDCPHPRNEKKIKENFEKFKLAKKLKRPKHKIGHNGKPLILFRAKK